MKKLQKRYYILIFVAALFAGVLVREMDTASFKIVKTTAVYAPEAENIIIEEDELTDFKININTASLPELMVIPGVGEKTAMRIIEYRTQYGDFEACEDIMKITGIGEKKFAEMREHLCVSDD